MTLLFCRSEDRLVLETMSNFSGREVGFPVEAQLSPKAAAVEKFGTQVQCQGEFARAETDNDALWHKHETSICETTKFQRHSRTFMSG